MHAVRSRVSDRLKIALIKRDPILFDCMSLSTSIGGIDCAIGIGRPYRTRAPPIAKQVN